jgi:two-component system OmpR family response regulator
VPANREPRPGKRYRFDRWLLDMSRRELSGADGVAVQLSTGEFRLLAALIQRPHIVLSRDQLLDLTSGRASEPFDRSIDNQVSRLRKKIERDPKNAEIVKTVWGGGYVLAADVREE